MPPRWQACARSGKHPPGAPRTRGAAVGLTVMAVVVGVHLALGGAAVAAWGCLRTWSRWSTASGASTLTVLALVAGHAALPVLGLRLRRHFARKRRTG